MKMDFKNLTDQDVLHLITEKYASSEFRKLPAQKRFDLSYLPWSILAPFPIEQRQKILNAIFDGIESLYDGRLDTKYDDLIMEKVSMDNLSILLNYLINNKYPHHFTINDDLNKMLRSVDIFDSLTCEFLQLPFQNCSIEFGTSRDTDINIGTIYDDKEYPLESVYLVENFFKRAGDIKVNSEHFNLHPERGGRIITIVTVGSPVNGNNLLDDAFLTQDLFIQEENESVNDMLERNNDGYRKSNISKGANQVFFNKQRDSMDKVVKHLVTTLLYILSSDCRQEVKNELSDVEKKIRSIGPKKKAKLERKQYKLYDKILITSQTLSELDDTQELEFELEEQQKGKKKHKHLRRAHLRNQACGVGHKDRKIIFIKPSIVNPTSEEQPIKPEYQVK